MTVRRVRPADAEAWRALRLEALADNPVAFLERYEDAAARPLTEWQERAGTLADGTEQALFVVTDGDRLVAMAGGFAARDRPGRTVVFTVYVAPALRGRGLVDELVEAVAAWSASTGRDELALQVALSNGRARAAYERLGFVATGETEPHPLYAGEREEWMVRRAARPHAPQPPSAGS